MKQGRRMGGPGQPRLPWPVLTALGPGREINYAWECQDKVGLPRMTAGREPWNIWEERSDVRRCGRLVGRHGAANVKWPLS